jgi:hypothetical protein
VLCFQVALVAESTFATTPMVVMLKGVGPGGTAKQMNDTTFTDSASLVLPQHQVCDVEGYTRQVDTQQYVVHISWRDANFKITSVSAVVFHSTYQRRLQIIMLFAK